LAKEGRDMNDVGFWIELLVVFLRIFAAGAIG